MYKIFVKYLLALFIFSITTSLSAQSKKTKTEKYLAKCYVSSSVVTNHPQLSEDICKLTIHPKKHEYGYLCEDTQLFDVIGKWKKIDGNKIQLINKEAKDIIELTIDEWSNRKIILSGFIGEYNYKVTLLKR